MDGNIFELLVALAIIFFGLLGGGRKKKRPTPPRQDPRPPVANAERRVPVTEGQGASAGHRAPRTGRDELFSEIERILRGQVPPPEERPIPPPRTPEPHEAYSLEALDGESVEVDEAQRHQEFHDKYVTPRTAGPLPAATVAQRPAAHVRRIPLRQAVMWREILGPPKGLQ